MFGGSNPEEKELDAWVEQSPETCVNDRLANLDNMAKHVNKSTYAEFGEWNDAPVGHGKALSTVGEALAN
jgi:hypothetical protein